MCALGSKGSRKPGLIRAAAAATAPESSTKSPTTLTPRSHHRPTPPAAGASDGFDSPATTVL
jgi:hypothetical protein